jgi:integrase
LKIGKSVVVRTNLKGVFATYKLLRDGNRKAYWYHRRTGKRLHGEPGSSEFIADYAASEQNVSEYHGGTFNSLIREYTLSDEFEELLAPSTKTEYRRMLSKTEVVFGDMPLVALEDPRVKKEFLDWRQSIAREAGLREADNRLSAISAMLTWAVERGRLTINHVKGFKRLYHSDRSEIIWLPEHIHAFMKVAPVEVQQALILALHTGQRQGDLLRLPWSSYDGQRIQLRQGKRRRGQKLAPLIEIPCTEALRRMLDKMERVSPLILATKTARSFKKRWFSNCWDRVMHEAGVKTITLPDIAEPVTLHFHDLRGTTITLLSEAGCNDQQIATITGHSLKTVHQILERYLARTKGLAEQAIINFENSPRTKFANQLQTEAPAGTNGNKKQS